jgi:hypothetical protein
MNIKNKNIHLFKQTTRNYAIKNLISQFVFLMIYYKRCFEWNKNQSD